MKKIIPTENATGALELFSQAVEANGILFNSDQVPVNPQSGKIDEGKLMIMPLAGPTYTPELGFTIR